MKSSTQNSKSQFSPFSLASALTTFALAGALALAVGCSSKKKTEDSLAPETATSEKAEAPQIESTPLSFDTMGSDSGKISGLETINFDYDKSALSADSKKKLQGNADWIKKNAGVKVTIEGHCDAKGSTEYNIALGERRAKSVRDYMVSLGVSGSRLNTVSYGKEKPVVSGDSEEANRKNRRANFVPNK